VETFQLGSYANISAIKKQCQSDNKSMVIQAIGEAGYKIPLLPYLQHLLKQSPPSNPDVRVVVKFAFYGATMTSGKQIQQELGGVQVLTFGELLSNVKSPKNCNIILIYIGGETDEGLHESLANVSKVMTPLTTLLQVMISHQNLKLHKFVTNNSHPAPGSQPKTTATVSQPIRRSSCSTKGIPAKRFDDEELDIVEEYLNLTLHDIATPNSYKEAINSPQADQWCKAIDDEFNSLIKNGKFKLVPRPTNCKVISAKWVYKILCMVACFYVY